MLYLLLGAGDHPFFNVLRYPSFRILAAGLVALVVGIVFGAPYIAWLRFQQKGISNVREDTPDTHQRKRETPTLGGGLLLAAFTLAVFLFADLRSLRVWALLIFTLGFGGIGFADDWLKLSKRNSKGLPGRLKIAWQTAIYFAVIFGLFTEWTAHASFPFLHARLLIDSALTAPFVPLRHFHPHLGWWYVAFGWIVIVGTSHAVNLADGLDGLAMGTVTISATVWLALSYVASVTIRGFDLARYLGVASVPGGQELAVGAAALVGAGIAFLWFNSNPASVFMGDIGSLALGGALGAFALLTKNELESTLVHALFLVEALSVIFQVASFKWRGKRIFKMAPIHHHFELLGWPEQKVVVRFWILSILAAGVALASLKLR